MKLAGDSGAKEPNYRHPRTSTFEQCTPQVLPLARRADLLGLHRGTHFAFCHPFVCGQWEFLQRTGGGGGEGGRAHSPQTPSYAVLSSAPCRSLFQALMTSPRCPALGRRDNNASCPVTALGAALPLWPPYLPLTPLYRASIHLSPKDATEGANYFRLEPDRFSHVSLNLILPGAFALP